MTQIKSKIDRLFDSLLMSALILHKIILFNIFKIINFASKDRNHRIFIIIEDILNS